MNVVIHQGMQEKESKHTEEKQSKARYEDLA